MILDSKKSMLRKTRKYISVATILFFFFLGVRDAKAADFCCIISTTDMSSCGGITEADIKSDKDFFAKKCPGVIKGILGSYKLTGVEDTEEGVTEAENLCVKYSVDGKYSSLLISHEPTCNAHGNSIQDQAYLDDYNKSKENLYKDLAEKVKQDRQKLIDEAKAKLNSSCCVPKVKDSGDSCHAPEYSPTGIDCFIKIGIADAFKTLGIDPPAQYKPNPTICNEELATKVEDTILSPYCVTPSSLSAYDKVTLTKQWDHGADKYVYVPYKCNDSDTEVPAGLFDAKTAPTFLYDKNGNAVLKMNQLCNFKGNEDRVYCRCNIKDTSNISCIPTIFVSEKDCILQMSDGQTCSPTNKSELGDKDCSYLNTKKGKEDNYQYEEVPWGLPDASMLNQFETTDPKIIIGRVIQTAMGVMGSIALAMSVYGGILWLTAMGNSERQKKGTGIILWSALGVIVILSSYALVKFVFEVF